MSLLNLDYKIYNSILKNCSLWMGLNWLKTKEPQRRENLFFTVKSSRGFGTHLIDLGRMKG